MLSSSKFDIRSYGAIGDGITECTQALQKAIDDCASDGGGTVIVAGGRYLFYPVWLKTGVLLEVQSDAVMLAGTNPEKYPEIPENPYWNVGFALRHNRRYVFYAQGAERIGIIGHGVIDFQGMAFVDADPSVIAGEGRWKRFSDTMVPGRSIFFVGCRDVRLEDVTLADTAGGWFTWFLDCEDILIRGVTMRADLRMPNSDGLHMGSCRNVRVSDCDFQCGGDDCIIIRSMQEQFGTPKPSENITVTNCICRGGKWSSAILIGWTFDYAIRNCVFSNIVVTSGNRLLSISAPDIDFSESKDPPRYPDTPPLPPIAPMQIENILLSNIVSNTDRLLALEIDDGCKADYIRNIRFHNIQAVCTCYPLIDVQMHHNVSDIEFSDVTLELLPAPDVPDLTPNKFHGVPGPFLSCPHVKNLFLSNFRYKGMRTSMTAASADCRK